MANPSNPQKIIKLNIVSGSERHGWDWEGSKPSCQKCWGSGFWCTSRAITSWSCGSFQDVPNSSGDIGHFMSCCKGNQCFLLRWETSKWPYIPLLDCFEISLLWETGQKRAPAEILMVEKIKKYVLSGPIPFYRFVVTISLFLGYIISYYKL